ncbi:unnamed protein product, partial [Prorocentrum cordatum]
MVQGAEAQRRGGSSWCYGCGCQLKPLQLEAKPRGSVWANGSGPAAAGTKGGKAGQESSMSGGGKGTQGKGTGGAMEAAGKAPPRRGERSVADQPMAVVDALGPHVDSSKMPPERTPSQRLHSAISREDNATRALERARSHHYELEQQLLEARAELDDACTAVAKAREEKQLAMQAQLPEATAQPPASTDTPARDAAPLNDLEELDPAARGALLADQ